MLVNLSVPDAILRKLLLHIIIKTRKRVLPVIPLIPTDFFCFLGAGGALGDSFSFIDVGSASLPT